MLLHHILLIGRTASVCDLVYRFLFIHYLLLLTENKSSYHVHFQFYELPVYFIRYNLSRS